MIELIVIAILVVICIILIWLVLSLKEELTNLRFAKQSQSVKYGQLTEQWLPFAKKYPYNSQNFRFIGKPIDGLAFEDEKVVFVEFKTNKSSLSKVQRKVRDLIREKKVEWLELRVD
ncbi:MAG: endonuclease [Candidatus Diapherotrites archaeon]|jgi:predicted Holliday junction resolvase-like endonuclease|uniref:Endonuclease n=1 Tax=Candidatus Iainarchaeum sp. TaxID=3101447 RepID=A0A8T5GGK7_9ARCH|nr:endonuclease [Candidatus Diapherotrites archaeon]MBT7241378.1 endonuclease [Candidatus Diapherotrites archaeon]